MTLDELKTKYGGLIHRSSALELKKNPVFMSHCRENEDFKQYVASQKPTMKTVRVPVIEFKRPERVIVTDKPKTSQIKRDAVVQEVEEVPKVIQYYRDVVAYGKLNGFLS